GPAIRGFAFAVISGVLIGTYSSIFVAAPLVFDWLKLTKSSVKLRGSSAS
ncbi:MAG: protein translocase subunit SecF, partial [Chlorobiaceae bacterium]|nr:protein translocase subunit SecF [Chlorobiaceae bacterium]